MSSLCPPGLSILRLHIGSTANNSIQPVDPGGPNATPRYVWNRDDESQVWLAQQAKAYGVNRFYANAWSAPDYTATYSSMRFTPAQAVEFTKVLGPIAANAGLKVACCDSFGWSQQRNYTTAIE